jgi:hypothetical protein
MNQENFSIDEKYEFLDHFATMVAEKQTNSLIVIGEGGIGKTYTIMNSVKRIGDGHIKVGGHMTSRALYNLLYDFNGELFIFDDCDSVLKDDISQNLLKNALDSNDPREITWGAKIPKSEKDDYPQSFRFTGRIIFISNMTKEKIFQPILTRGYLVDLTMSFDDKIERIGKILKNVCIKNGFDVEVGEKAFEFIKEKKDIIKSLSLRTLLSVMKLINSREDWEKIAEYSVSQ